jgi:hypothetical protein
LHGEQPLLINAVDSAAAEAAHAAPFRKHTAATLPVPSDATLGSLESVSELAFDDLRKGTENFAAARIIGEGGFGKARALPSRRAHLPPMDRSAPQVYCADVAALPVRCAVKRIHAISADGVAQVWTEIRLLGSAACRRGIAQHSIAYAGLCDDVLAGTRGCCPCWATASTGARRASSTR